MKLKFWNKPIEVKDYFTETQLDAITEEVRKAELLTFGEIRVVIRGACENKLSSKEQALADFEAYGLANTRDKTGVLILIVLQERKVEVLADKGINDQVPKGYWDNIVRIITTSFKHNGLCHGIRVAVGMVGLMLQREFPRKSDDTNELPDRPEIVP